MNGLWNRGVDLILVFMTDNKAKKSIIYLVIFSVLTVTSCKSFRSDKNNTSLIESVNERGYFLNRMNGSDNNPGTLEKPLKSITELNLRLKKKAANICLAGGQVFDGKLILDGINGTDRIPIKIKSWGKGRAVINGGNGEAVRYLRHWQEQRQV